MASSKRVALDGGSVVTICEAPREGRGGTWAEDDSIVFAGTFGGLMRVRAGGPTSRSRNSTRPRLRIDGRQFLPGGKAVLLPVTAPRPGGAARSTSSLVTAARDCSTARRSEGSSPIRRHRILDVRPQRDFFAAAFDPVRLELLGPPFAVFEGVADDNRAAQMDASRTGVIARRQPKFHVAWLTRRARRRCLRKPETISAPCCRMPATGSRSRPAGCLGLRHPPPHTHASDERVGCRCLESLDFDDRFIVFNTPEGIRYVPADGGSEPRLLLPTERRWRG